MAKEKNDRMVYGSVTVIDPEKVHEIAVVFDTYKMSNYALVSTVWAKAEEEAKTRLVAEGFDPKDLFHQEQFRFDQAGLVTAQKRAYTPISNRKNT